MTCRDRTATTMPAGRPVLGEARRRAVLELVRSSGVVTVAEIEDRFGVSSMTARRDLTELERSGAVQRTHGGAVLPSATAGEDSFTERLERASAEKTALAVAAADMIGGGQSVFLDSSTTAYFVAQRLLELGTPCTVLTNSLAIMNLVATRGPAGIELVGLSGTLRPLTKSFVGPLVVDAVKRHFVDRLFLSVKGLAADGTLTEPDTLEAEVKRAMITRASSSVLLIDATKLGSRGLSVVGRASDFDEVLTGGLDAAGVDRLIAQGSRAREVAA